MEKLIALFLLVFSVSAYSVPYEVIIQQANATGSMYGYKFLSVPSAPSVLAYNPATNNPDWVELVNFTYGAGLLSPNIPSSPVVQRLRVQTDASGNYTWTYPVAYAPGIIPVITAVSESSSSTVPQGVQIVGVPTNTSATFKVINLPSTSVLSIVVLGAPTAAQAYIHLTAIAP